LLQRGEVGLRGRQVTRLQVLSELLEFLARRLHPVLDALGTVICKAAAGNA